MPAAEGRRLYDLMDALSQSKRHTPLLWACLTLLCAAAEVQPVHVQLLRRPELLKKIIASLQFYADVGPATTASNPYILQPSADAATTLCFLYTCGASLTAAELAQFRDMGVVPALTSLFKACALRRNGQAMECPGAGGGEDGEQEEYWNSEGAGSMYFNLGWAMACLAGVAVCIGGAISRSPPREQVAVVEAVLESLQALNDPGIAGLQEDKNVTCILWYWTGREDSDLDLYAGALIKRLLPMESDICATILPGQLKGNAGAALEMWTAVARGRLAGGKGAGRAAGPGTAQAKVPETGVQKM